MNQEAADWLNKHLDAHSHWEQHLGDELVPNILGVAPEDLGLTEALVGELLEDRAKRPPIQSDGKEPWPALKARLKQLGKQKMGAGRWQCPAHPDKVGALHITVKKTGDILFHCHGKSRKGKCCSQEQVRAAIGWEWADFKHPDNREDWAPTFVLDLYGQVHGPGVPEKPCFLTEVQTSSNSFNKGLEENEENRTHSLVHLAAKLLSGEVPMPIGKLPALDELEGRLASGDLVLDEALVAGPLPANPCSDRRAELHRAARDLILREIRLYAAAGEYRARILSRSYVAKKLGVSDTIARRVLQDFVTVKDGVSTFARHSAPRHPDQPASRCPTYCYCLPRDVPRFNLDVDTVPVKLGLLAVLSGLRVWVGTSRSWAEFAGDEVDHCCVVSDRPVAAGSALGGLDE